MFLLNWLWQIEIGKLEFVGRWFWHPEIMKFEFLQPVFLKSYIFWPQQPPTEIVSDTSENLDFSWLIPQKRASVGHFGTRGDQIIKEQEVLWVNRAVEVAEASEAAEAGEVNETAEVSKASKSLLRNSKVSRFLNSALFWSLENVCFW